MPKPEKEFTTTYVIWHLVWLCVFINGILDHNWYQIIGAFLINFDSIEIIHWQGKQS